MIEVLSPGSLTLVQDRGRPGLARLGVAPAGAMDRAALALGNRLVGNPPDSAGLEVLLGGLVLHFAEATWIAVTGAWGPVTVDDEEVPAHTAVLAGANAVLRMGPATAGVRYYLAVRGGIAVPPVLGSRSRDTLAGLGPLPLGEGDRLTVGSPGHPVPAVDLVPVDPPPVGEVTLHVRPGPRVDWFAPAAWDALLRRTWIVSTRSDRTGIRLEGVPLTRRRHDELPSEGMIAGAIQVSPDGSPTILAVDHPITGGYPVIAVLTDESLDALGQLRPGQRIRFTLAIGHR